MFNKSYAVATFSIWSLQSLNMHLTCHSIFEASETVRTGRKLCFRESAVWQVRLVQ